MDIYPERLIEKLPILKNFFYRLLLPIDKYILQNSSKVITISNDMFEEIVEKRKLKPENVSIVYNWINIEEEYDFESKKSDENFKFLYLGNIGPAAGLQNAIDAFSKFNNSPINLTIAGSGSEKDKLQAYVNRNQLKNIDFKEVPHGMVFKMQSNADVLLLPMQKGLGKVLLPSKFTSYLFSSKPILAITDKNCEIDKLINEFRCGWVIAHDEIDRLPNLIHEISIMPSEKLTEMGRNSFKLAQHFFSKNMNLQKICSDIMQCAHL
jgi:glycosyltransferase involved in cell wall biosynthesis